MIKVLIVEDSVSVQHLLTNILTSDPGIKVIGTARDGIEALEFLDKAKPDIITMDYHMPRMDGLEVTRRIMETDPVPIVIVSASWEQGNKALAFKFMDAGAVAAVEKPAGIGHPDYERLTAQLLQTVKSMSEVKVVTRYPRSRNRGLPSHAATPVKKATGAYSLIAIGASTGGPPVLKQILCGLPTNLPLPIMIVQHIAQGFTSGMADWLMQTTPWKIKVAVDDEELQPGIAYIAPDGYHMGVTRSEHIILSSSPPENGLRPAVSYMFRSVAHAIGSKAIGVLLTGMGRDGADGLKVMLENGAVTIAQDRESSVVFGMPGEAVKLGAATYILPPERIIETLRHLAFKT